MSHPTKPAGCETKKRDREQEQGVTQSRQNLRHRPPHGGDQLRTAERRCNAKPFDARATLHADPGSRFRRETTAASLRAGCEPTPPGPVSPHL